jgi:LTXXQ motif family protein
MDRRIGAAAVFLLAIIVPCVPASARFGGGGGGAHFGGGHFGGGGGAHFGGGGGAHFGGSHFGGGHFGGHGWGGGARAPFVGGSHIGSHPFMGSRSHIVSHPFIGSRMSHSIARPRVGPFPGSSFRGQSRLARQSTVGLSRPAALHTSRAAFATLGRSNPVLRNRALLNPAVRFGGNRALAHSVFAGRFAGNRFWWHRNRGFVIGWFWPLFWPYLYDDISDYTYWPYGYDEFWPYAYDDVYYGVYGPYSYAYDTTGTVPKRRKYRHEAVNNGICGQRIPAWSDWPIEQISKQVVVDPSQQGALDELKSATARAVQVLQSACPSEVANTPLGRMQAIEYRLETMLQAVRTIRPALEGFYNALNDEQKARFNLMGAESDDARVADHARADLAEICSHRGVAMVDVPIERIEQAVRPTQAQAQALEKLKSANASASESLKANCPAYRALTPTERVAAMEQRLDAAQVAVKSIEPALKDFYGSLSDEQKARFNSIGTSVAGG